ncbi:MAG TPA: SCO family protein [Candidatus Methylacidiphilales bacterium]
MKTLFLLLCLASTALAGQPIQTSTLSPDQLKDVGIVQRIGAQVPPGLVFTDSDGSRVELDALLARKPTLLVPVYYACPNLCTVVLNALVQSLADLRRTAGDGFQIVAVSIDPRETPDLAAEKKASYLRLYGRGSADAWTFLTGDPFTIRRLTEAVGYRFRYDEQANQFAHGSGLIVLDPSGKVTQYLLGIEYRPAEIEAAIRNAAAGRTGAPVSDLALLCYRYNPLTGPYGTAVAWALKGASILAVLLLGGYIVRQLRREQQRTPQP